MESEFPAELQSETFKVLNSNDSTVMETLFSHLYSSQHQHQRSQALTFLQCCKKHHPDLLFIKLIYLLSTSSDDHARANAARALLFVQPSELWPKILPLAQTRLQAHFIDLLTKETSINVLRLASLVLAETVSVIYKTHQRWPEILDFLLSSIASNDDKFRELALLVFTSLPNDTCSLISDSLRERNGVVRFLHSSFLTSLASTNPDVKVASFGAVVNLVKLFSEPSVFHELLRAMMVGAFSLLQSFEGRYFKSAFAELINLTSKEPVLLKPYMSDMILDALQIAESKSLRVETHRSAFELVMAMTEVKECEQVLLNLPEQTVIRLFVVPMKMLLCVQEDGERGSEEGEKVDVYKFGIKCLKKLCISLEGSKVVPIAYDSLSIHLDATEWKKRHAGIALLSVIAEDQLSDEMILMENFLGEVVTKVLKSFQDSQVQVRLAAFKLMEMPTNFVQAAQILYSHRFVHAFSVALHNEQDYKVKEQAASAMLFFLKNTLPDSLTLYNVDTVMGKLLSLLQRKESVKLRTVALSAFNIVAQRCHEVARKYSTDFLPILLEACNDKNSEIQEEAARGIRICVEFGTPQLKPFVNRILSELSTLMKDPNRSLSENAKACDIAVSALGRICEFHRDSIDGSKIVPAWLSFLPLKDDLIEAKIMHEQLCLMVARLDKDLLGAGNQNLVKIIAVFLEVIDKGDKLATTQTIMQMNNLLIQLGRQIPRSAFDTILLSLNAKQRELLLALISS